MNIIAFLLLALLSFPSFASEGVLHSTPYTLCFTPGGNCTRDITTVIRSAQRSVYVQAFSFTSMPIAMALATAQKHHVTVGVILDKSQRKYPSRAVKTLLLNGISVSIDRKPAIAHNKVMIVDGETVITGSFNFTYAAQYRNAENVLILHDHTLAQQYLRNWQWRHLVSVPLYLPDLAPAPWWEEILEWVRTTMRNVLG